MKKSFLLLSILFMLSLTACAGDTFTADNKSIPADLVNRVTNDRYLDIEYYGEDYGNGGAIVIDTETGEVVNYAFAGDGEGWSDNAVKINSPMLKLDDDFDFNGNWEELIAEVDWEKAYVDIEGSILFGPRYICPLKSEEGTARFYTENNSICVTVDKGDDSCVSYYISDTMVNDAKWAKLQTGDLKPAEGDVDESESSGGCSCGTGAEIDPNYDGETGPCGMPIDECQCSDDPTQGTCCN